MTPQKFTRGQLATYLRASRNTIIDWLREGVVREVEVPFRGRTRRRIILSRHQLDQLAGRLSDYRERRATRPHALHELHVAQVYEGRKRYYLQLWRRTLGGRTDVEPTYPWLLEVLLRSRLFGELPKGEKGDDEPEDDVSFVTVMVADYLSPERHMAEGMAMGLSQAEIDDGLERTVAEAYKVLRAHSTFRRDLALERDRSRHYEWQRRLRAMSEAEKVVFRARQLDEFRREIHGWTKAQRKVVRGMLEAVKRVEELRREADQSGEEGKLKVRTFPLMKDIALCAGVHPSTLTYHWKRHRAFYEGERARIVGSESGFQSPEATGEPPEE